MAAVLRRCRPAGIVLLIAVGLALAGCDRLILRGEGGPRSGADWAVGVRL